MTIRRIVEKSISDEDFRKMLSVSAGRDRILLRAMHDYGLRSVEIADLSWSNIRPTKQGAVIAINGTADQVRIDRQIPIDKEFYTLLLTLKKDEGFVFRPRNATHQMDIGGLYHVVNYAVQRAGLNKKISPKTLWSSYESRQPKDSKTCSKCHTSRPVGEFRRLDETRLRSWCLHCEREYAREIQDNRRQRAELPPIPRTKFCPKCSEIKPGKSFGKNAAMADGRNSWCISCIMVATRACRAARRERDPVRFKCVTMASSARYRARKEGLPFNIDYEWVYATFGHVTHCPILGIPLDWPRSVRSQGPAPNSPTLDKIIPTKGYVKGNVIVTSHQANLMKNNATFEELQRFCRYWLKQSSG